MENRDGPWMRASPTRAREWEDDGGGQNCRE